jgi:DNA-directed RNA polymerase specialized sigma24 family protein
MKNWLFNLFHKVHLSHIRRQPSVPSIVELEDRTLDLSDTTSSTNLDPLGNYPAALKRQNMHKTIDSLESIYREAIILHELERQNYQQTAEVLHCSTGIVMSRLGYLREKLTRVLEYWHKDSNSTII